jgi:hypothetical protein
LAVSSSCSDALDGSVFASFPFDRETIEWLSLRAKCFLKARETYLDLYETYEFDSRLQWYDTSAGKEFDDQADRGKLARLTDDLEPFDDDRRAELDQLDSFEIPWLLIPTEELPGSGNLRTECDQLVMSLRGESLNTVELRWVCYLKHTDVELRTFDISSEDIDRWLAELEQGDHRAETATHSEHCLGQKSQRVAI